MTETSHVLFRRELIDSVPMYSADRDQYQLGSLSHLLNTKASGYQELPEWPEEAPDPTVRNVEVRDPLHCQGGGGG